MTDDEVAEAERLSHEFERKIKRRPGTEESSKWLSIWICPKIRHDPTRKK